MLEETPELFEDKEGSAAAIVTSMESKHDDIVKTDPLLNAISSIGKDIQVPGGIDASADTPMDGAAGTRADIQINVTEKQSITDNSQIVPSGVSFAVNEPAPHIQSHPVDDSRYIMNLDDYVIEADENFERFTGYGKEDIESGRLRQRSLIPEEDRELYFAEVDKQMEKGNFVYMEHYLLRKDGQRIYVFWYARKFYHSASRTLRIEVVIVDMASTQLMNKNVSSAH